MRRVCSGSLAWPISSRSSTVCLRTGKPGGRLVHPVPRAPAWPASVMAYVVTSRPLVRAGVGPHQAVLGEAAQLGVDLAHRGGDPVEAERHVGALLDLVPRQLVAEGEEAEDRVARHRKVLTHRRSESSVPNRNSHATRRRGGPDVAHAAHGRNPQGPVARDLGRGPHVVGVDRAALPDGGGLLRHDRHPRRARRGCSPGASSSWLGPQVWRSDDLGATWDETPNGAARFPEDTGATLARVWQLQPGASATAATASSGRAPSRARSSARPTGARRFSLVRGLWDHPHRPEWNEGFGGQAFHTILPHPSDAVARARRAVDGRRLRHRATAATSWSPSNTGVKAEFFPGERNYPEFGQCVHKVARDAADPERLYLQNHGGVYRSDDGGASWQDIAPGLPTEFGFAMVAHPHRADTAYNFPITGAEARWPVDGKARVYRTTDAGSSWEPLGEGGLPDGYYTAVMRDAMCADDHEPGRPLLRRPQRRRLGLTRRGRVVAGDPQGPAGRPRGRGPRARSDGLPHAMADFSLSRSTRIQASPDRVHALLDDFRQWQKWSPWEGVDPDHGPGVLRARRTASGRRTTGPATRRPARARWRSRGPRRRPSSSTWSSSSPSRPPTSPPSTSPPPATPPT